MTTFSRKCLVERPIVELIQDLKVRLHLLEGDRTAYYEKSFFTMQANKEKISSLRKEVHDLHLLYRETLEKDENIVSQAFQNRPIEKSAFNGKKSEVATEEFDFRVSAAMKRFNHSKYVTSMKQQRLFQLKRELVDAQEELTHDLAQTNKKTAQYQMIRDLENRVDKLELKGNECEFIQKTYNAIYWRLYEEHVSCNSTLDKLELDIIRCRAENAELKKTHQEATTMRDVTQKELHQHDQFEQADRKRREIEAARMKRVVEEERKRSTDRVERSKVRLENELHVEFDDSSLDIVSGIEEVPGGEVDYEELENSIERLRTLTGIADIHDAANHFESQLIVKEKLVELINNMEKRIMKLREDCASKQESLIDVKKVFETVTSGGLDGITERNEKVNESAKENQYTTEKFDNVSHFFAESKAGLDSLVEKLTHVKLVDKPVYTKPGSPEEYMSEAFRIIKQKVEVLLKELEGHDIEAFRKKMKLEQEIVLFQKNELEEQLKQQLPPHNKRVLGASDKCSDEEELDSGPDNPTFKDRAVMKHDSSVFIEMRLKKRHRKRKHRK